ncbi:MAG: hypothetical protein S4CHLAM6_10890 [Chlamydiae bacterium]|nr:hypothetical protein [Chlamydiota bacterium]
MVKGIPAKKPQDDEFMHQYGGGVNQYGTKGASSPDQFQNYMNDGMTTQGAGDSNSGPSPFEMMAQQQNQNFGAPTPQGSSSLDGAAPENFGPPGISQTSKGQSFGAPGFQDPKNQAGQSATGPSQETLTPGSNTQFGAPLATQTQAAAKTSPQSGPIQGKQAQSAQNSTAKTPGGKPKKKTSKKTVEKMEMEGMMQNIIAHMKVKDPDPGAWK